MSRPVQLRVLRQLTRLEELCALRRPLTDAEQDEVKRLDLAERRRAAVRRWYQGNPDNRRRMVELGRQWRQANPGCC